MDAIHKTSNFRIRSHFQPLHTVMFLAVFTFIPVFGMAQSSTNPVQLENDSLRLQFSSTNGALLSVYHKAAGLELLSITAKAGQPLWILQFLGSGNSNFYADSSSSTTQFTSVLSTNSSGETLQFTWRGLRANGTSYPNTTITATVTVQNGNPLSSWQWQARNMPGLPVTWLIFPNLSGLGPLGASGNDDVLLWPGEDGRLFQNPWANLGWGWGNLYPSAFTTMQFMALYDPSGGFYFGTQDTNARVKLFQFARDDKAAGDFLFQTYHQFDDITAAALQLPYDFVLGTFTGDWTTAAEMYRQWAVQQPWVLNAGQKQTPQWLLNIGPAADYCAHACQPMPDKDYVEDATLRQNTGQFFQMSELAILWGWEKYGAWYYGDYFPPSEGWASLDTFVTSIHQIPDRVGLFISPNFITASTALWSGGTMQPYAALDATGEYQSTDLDGIRQWMLMDIATPAWQQALVTDVNTLAQHGIDLIQLDGFPWNAPYVCYATTHGHPVGDPATWETSAWFDFLSTVRASAKAIKSDIAFSSEGIAEVYIPYIDMHHSRDNWFELVDSSELAVGAQPMPLFEYVYHPWILTRGEYALDSNTTFGLSDYQKLAIARTLTWGQEHNYSWNQPYNSPNLDMQALAYIRTVTAARQGFAKPYLVYGQMLPPLAIGSPMSTISWSFSGDGSGTGSFPAIQHSEWRAVDGSVGIVLTNISAQALNVSVPISFSKLGLTSNVSYTVSLIGSSSPAQMLNQITGDSAVTVSVAPLQVELLEITPSGAGPAVISVAPQSVSAGSGSFILTVTGSGFSRGDTVLWNGAALPTAFISSSELQATVINSLIAQAGTISIAVSVSGTQSPASASISFAVGGSSASSTSITYYFPHLAFGGGWQTTLTYVNYSPQSVSCQTAFYSDSGAPLQVPFADDGTVSTRTDNLGAGTDIHVQTQAAASAGVLSGWAEAQCTGPLKASLLYRVYNGSAPQGESGVNAVTAPATEFVSFAQTATGVAYANPSSSPTAIAITALDETGATLGSTSLILQPSEHGSANIGPMLGLSSFTGSVQVTSTFPIVALFLNAEAYPVFSSLPPAELPNGTPLSSGVGGAQSNPIGTTYYFPHLAFGGGWQTTLTYVNYSPQSVTCNTSFYADSGAPLQVPFADDGTVSTRTDNLGAGADIHVQTQAAASAGVLSGWAEAQCTAPLKASLLYRLYSGTVAQGEAGVNAVTTPATEFASFAQTATGLAYANPSSSPANITITALDSTGATLGSTSMTLQPNAHGAANIGPMLGLTSFSGSVQVTSTFPIVTLFLNAEAYPVFSSLPAAGLPNGTPLAGGSGK
jgi:hypothetical protein